MSVFIAAHRRPSVQYLIHVTDYQATSNSWTFLEVNVGIICACESRSSFCLFDDAIQSKHACPNPQQLDGVFVSYFRELHVQTVLTSMDD